MKTKLILIALFLLTACSPRNTSPSTTLPERANPWLGQAEPGSSPSSFGIGFMTGEFHTAPTFTPDGNSVYWAGGFALEQIYTSHFEDGDWTAPESVSFSPNMTSYRDPFVSPDGKKLYFISNDPLPGSTGRGKENIWVMDWDGKGWGEPQPLPEVINQYELHWTISVDAQYNLYYSVIEDNDPNIYFSAFIDGQYTDPIRLPSPVNSDWQEITPNIAPDGSYLLFSRTRESSSMPGLYITYQQDGSWTEPIIVGNVFYSISPIVTPDRKYVIYLSSPSSMEWRDTYFVEQLRP